MRQSMYHSILRITALVCAIVLAFDSGVFSPITRELSRNTQHYLAQSVGVGATVQPNEINELSAQIAQRDRELDDREEAIAERELEIGLSSGAERVGSSVNISTYILSTLLFIIIVLIVLNYALDFTRERRMLHAARSMRADL